MKTKKTVPIQAMSLDLTIQRLSEEPGIPADDMIESWVQSVLADMNDDLEMTIRIVDEQEGAKLNEQWRHKSGPTNVLSFAYAADDDMPANLLGDLVICAPVVSREANEQNKTKESHWAHMVVHGSLHLLGHDHEQETEAKEMEALECTILEKLGYADPYTMDEHT